MVVYHWLGQFRVDIPHTISVIGDIYWLEDLFVGNVHLVGQLAVDIPPTISVIGVIFCSCFVVFCFVVVVVGVFIGATLPVQTCEFLELLVATLELILFKVVPLLILLAVAKAPSLSQDLYWFIMSAFCSAVNFTHIYIMLRLNSLMGMFIFIYCFSTISFAFCIDFTVM